MNNNAPKFQKIIIQYDINTTLKCIIDTDSLIYSWLVNSWNEIIKWFSKLNNSSILINKNDDNIENLMNKIVPINKISKEFYAMLLKNIVIFISGYMSKKNALNKQIHSELESIQIVWMINDQVYYCYTNEIMQLLFSYFDQGKILLRRNTHNNFKIAYKKDKAICYVSTKNILGNHSNDTSQYKGIYISENLLAMQRIVILWSIGISIWLYAKN